MACRLEEEPMPRLLLTLIAGIAAFTLLPSPCPVFAQTEAPVLEKWYPALFAADAETLGSLLSNDAEIRLEDLGITQTKAEFLESLGAWKDSIEGAAFAWKLAAGAPASATEATALVCYRFPSNELLTREVFTFAAGKITESVQTTEGESCAGF
ncbi:MAG: hypothetical protein CML29_10865 [Rhizobiales bacterium]|nr:hypothetical protein [Hyphomicrobiales bacterium]MBA70226.1 hypothetical protein [Hyphomicrobiales bacterium]|tara:strand:- start:1 stop:462 length:462 start_codon:yes stop_codon:yes gene_type:complete